MKTTLTYLLALLLSTTAFAQQSRRDPTAVGNDFFRALLDEDSKVLRTVMSSDLTFTNFDGDTIDGDSLARSIDEGSFTIETATVSDAQTRQLTNDAALITGEWKAKGLLEGTEFNDTLAFSVLCTRQADGWRIVNVQFTPVRQ